MEIQNNQLKICQQLTVPHSSLSGEVTDCQPRADSVLPSHLGDICPPTVRAI